MRGLSEGDHFGEMSLFSHGPRTATVSCISEVNLVMFLPYMKFKHLIKKFPEFANCLKLNARNTYLEAKPVADPTPKKPNDQL